MPTGQAVVNSALTVLGILEQGGTASYSDLSYGLSELNDMWQAWGIDEGLIFALQTGVISLASGTPSYALGPGGTSPFNTTLPSRIYKANYLTAGGRNELRIVNADQYYSHNDLSAAAAAPDEIYPDFNVASATGQATVYLWPVPNISGSSLEMQTGAAFTTWQLGTNYYIPQGYQDAIKWALAFRMLSAFGMAVAQQVAQVVTVEATKAENRIREMNKFNRQLPPGTDAVPTPAEMPKGA